jgi:ligand-binding sensor protein
MTQEFKTVMIQQIADMSFGSGKAIVDTNNFVPFCQQLFAQMRPKETTTAGDHNSFAQMHWPSSLFDQMMEIAGSYM